MAETQIVDEVVSTRTNGGGLQARRQVDETVDAGTGATKVAQRGEEETMREGGRAARVFKESTQKLLDKLGANDEGDPDEDAPETEDAPEGAGAGDPDDVGLVDGAADADAGAADAVGDDAEKTEDAPADEELRTANGRLAETNRTLVAELEAARKTPARDRSEREVALAAAEQAYVDEGSVKALRKFLATVVGAAPDSKEVDAELSGLYADLTARELNVPLSESQQALREAAQARLARARDKREQAESAKKPAPTDDGGAQIEQASKYVDNLLVAKGSNAKSIADEFPMLMLLSEHYDGVRPAELIARAVQREYKTGTIDPRSDELTAIRKVARQIETHYTTAFEKASKLVKPKTDTTTGDPKKPAAANPASKEPRQSPGARTISNATASVAPGTKPKTKQTTAAPTEKSRKDFKTDAAWRQHLLAKHIPG